MSPTAADTEYPSARATLLESALRQERRAAVVLLVAVPLVSWSWIVVMARDMYGPMTGASRWMMTPTWDGSHLFLLWMMWAVMMTGMMLPSAAPMLLLFGAARRRQGGASGARQVYALAAGYLAVWALFSAAATAIQRVLAGMLVVSPMMELTSSRAGAALLVVAGVYQLSPLKRACLVACQAPMAFLMRRWRSGTGGAFRMGVEHGAYCVGCCWALMLLLFVGGVMNLAVIAALTVFVAFEKLTPLGESGARVSGILLVALGGWMLLR
jgi:predicted metal-binding membrane protein